ncbi:MAG: low-specificity L-threonine aldolase [Planctomycetota bacterium]
MKTIDLRSDTVTLPTAAMREAICNAELGDDVFGEDPTTIRLEEMAAERMGKEAAMLVASGTMGNLVCVLTHCGRGDEVILGDQSHTFVYEAGGIAALGGVHPHTIANQSDGTLRLEDIAGAIRADNVHFPRTRLVCLENTHNRCGGAVLSPDYIEQVAALAHDRGLRLHLDGARVFNAAVTLGLDVKELTRHVDSISFCLSKGLSAPVGSVVCGSKEFICEARRLRKSVGGGMRQCGIIAAAGIEALENMTARLAEDHANARRLAEGIAEIEGLTVEPERVQTNIVFFDIVGGAVTAERLVTRLSDRGVRILQLGPARVRAVTHYGIEAEDIEAALAALGEAMR